MEEVSGLIEFGNLKVSRPSLLDTRVRKAVHAHIRERIDIDFKGNQSAAANHWGLSTSAVNAAYNDSQKVGLALVRQLEMIDGWAPLHDFDTPGKTALARIVGDEGVTRLETEVLDPLIQKIANVCGALKSNTSRNRSDILTAVLRTIEKNPAALASETSLLIQTTEHLSTTSSVGDFVKRTTKGKK